MSSRTTAAQKEAINEFATITGASSKDASAFLKKHGWRLDAAMDAWYANPPPTPSKGVDRASLEKRLNELFDNYMDPEVGDITINGTIKLCEDLGVDPEDPAMLAVAYELKSPGVGEWKRATWIEGWTKHQCDSLPKMKAVIPQLSHRLANDTNYLQSVYQYTFDFAKTESGQRSIDAETAIAFWGLLLAKGLSGTALRHMDMHTDNDTGEVSFTESSAPGWKVEYNQQWFDFLKERNIKGISKDTWTMFFDFVRVIDAKFAKHDLTAAWPSQVDDFVEWMQGKV